MFDERAFLARVEDTNAETLADWLYAPTPDEENALRAFWGAAGLLGRCGPFGATRAISRCADWPCGAACGGA